jgi:hypothetical protein
MKRDRDAAKRRSRSRVFLDKTTRPLSCEAKGIEKKAFRVFSRFPQTGTIFARCNGGRRGIAGEKAGVGKWEKTQYLRL